ncbi:MAG: hypothetical protein KF799_10570 [Bdellovibrionales bacterium]|nr:hypothetical protein [Bdellovibrionales bacterium]
MKRWTSIATANEDARWNLLSERMKKQGIANEYVPWTGATDTFHDIATLKEFDHVRLSSRIGPRVLQSLKVQSTWTTMLGVIDGMVKNEHGWWPLCALYESFGQTLIRIGQQLDQRGNVFVAGAGGAARTAIIAFFKAGFRNFLLTNFVDSEADEMINDIRSKFFGLNIQWVPMDQIVLLPGETSVLVNCTPSVEENPLLIELSYLNFLKRPGFLVDISRSKKPSILVTEADDAGVNLITGVEIGARADVLWAKWAFQAEISPEEYMQEFGAALS